MISIASLPYPQFAFDHQKRDKKYSTIFILVHIFANLFRQHKPINDYFGKHSKTAIQLTEAKLDVHQNPSEHWIR